jgi:MFS family permease
MVSKYRSVLSVPGSRALILSAMVGRFPLGMSSLALLLLMRETHHSYAVAGFAIGAYALASAAAAPLQGRLVDRFGRKRVLMPCALAQALALVAFALASSSGAGGPGLIVLAALAGAAAPPVPATARALLREVFGEPSVRDTAYALDSVVQELVWVTGPLVVALVVGFSSPEVAVLLVAAVCIVGTTLFVFSPLARGSDRRRQNHERRSGVLSNQELRRLLGPVLLIGMGLGATEVGLPSLALHAGSRPSSGLLLAIWSVGSVIGGLWYGARVWNSTLSRRHRMLLFAAIVFTAPLILARTIPEGMIGSLLAGLTIAPVFSCQYALVGRAVRPGSENEAFTWVSASLIAGLAAGSAIGGASIGAGGVSAPFVISCLATAVAAALSLRTHEPAGVEAHALADRHSSPVAAAVDQFPDSALTAAPAEAHSTHR